MNKRINTSYRENLAFHILMVVVISLCLLIPTLFFNLVLDDRQSNEQYAINSMMNSWADEQILRDPEIIVGAKVLDSSEVEDNGVKRNRYKTKYAHIAPNKSHTSFSLSTQKRYRGNYEATLYTTEVIQEAEFNLYESLQEVKKSKEVTDLYTNDIKLFFAVQDPRGIDEIKSIKVNGKAYDAKPMSDKDGFMIEFAYNFNDFTQEKLKIEAHFFIRGSLSISFIPFAEISTFDIEGTGSIPSFKGGFLPRERTVNLEQKQFNASYYQNNLSTGQSLVSFTEKLTNKDSRYIIELQDEAKSYVLINRLTKYVLLFIAMTFVTVLAFEVVSQKLVSLVQYVVIGCALVLFYMVLLSLSEHISFKLSYLCASVLMSSMIALYIRAMFNSNKHALCILLMLFAMYAVLFAIVHIEAYALLVGTLLLITMLGVVMFITRNLNINDIFNTKADKSELKANNFYNPQRGNISSYQHDNQSNKANARGQTVQACTALPSTNQSSIANPSQPQVYQQAITPKQSQVNTQEDTSSLNSTYAQRQNMMQMTNIQGAGEVSVNNVQRQDAISDTKDVTYPKTETHTSLPAMSQSFEINYAPQGLPDSYQEKIKN